MGLLARTCLAAACCAVADGMIHGGRYKVSRDVFNDDGWAELGVFGYSERGFVEVDVVDLKVNDKLDIANITRGGPNNNTDGIGFFLLKKQQQSDRIELKSCMDPLSKDAENPVHELNWHPDGKGKYIGQLDFTKTSNGLPPGFWALVMYQCPPDAHFLAGSKFQVVVNEFQNYPGARSYLQVGDESLPYLFMLFSMVFFGLLAKWGHWMKLHKEHLMRIHFFMALALFLKGGSLFFESTRYFYYREHGNNSGLRDFMYFTFMSLKGTLLFAIIVLIGTGWSYLKPFLTPRDKKILLAVIPLQIIINILGYVVDHMRDGDPKWQYWQEKLTLLNLISCGLVMVPIAWSVRQLRNASETDGKVARNLQRMKQFRTLYVAMVVYVYFKTIICDMVLVECMGYQWTWVPPTLTEMSVAACFVFVGLKFRPMKQNPYTHLDEEDRADGGRALEMEMQERERDRRDLETANQPYDPDREQQEADF